MSIALSLLVLAAAAAPPEAARAIIDTEQAFAADTAARGPAYSFRDYVAPSAIALLPDPVSGRVEVAEARKRIEGRPRPPAPVPANIHWWPVVAGIAGSGEIGFTSGPVSFAKPGTYGFIFTVWERQVDGSWKFFFDGGPNVDGPPQFKPADPVRLVKMATRRSRSPDAALREVAAAEAGIAVAAGKDLLAAYRPYLGDDTQLMGSGGQPTFGPVDAPAELARRGKRIDFEPLGARAANSADFVFTYGRAVVDGAGQGGYTRIWQNSRRGWRIIVDQVQVPKPPPSQN